MPVAELKHVERNTFEHIMCPNCSRLHQIVDISGPIELPVRCLRCKCPMEPKAAEKWINERAETEHDQAISDAGAKLRGEWGQNTEIAELRKEVARLSRLVEGKK